MVRMSKWLSRGLGKIGIAFIGFAYRCVHRVQGFPTRLSSALTWRSLLLALLFGILLTGSWVGSCLYHRLERIEGAIMAQPISQGGIDYPDGGFSSGSSSYPMIGDLAELAARLGSPNTYDRRGTVIWMTDFEYGLQGVPVLVSEAETTYLISANRARFGPYSLKLDPSDEEDSFARWISVIHFMLTGKLGLETLISTDTDPYGVRLRMLYFDGTTQQEGALHYDPATGNWTILTGADTWTTILAGYKLQQGDGAWNPIKLIIDAEDGKYVRMQVAREVVELSEYDLYSVASGNLGQLMCQVYAYGAPASHAAIYVDSIIITQNE